MEWRFNGIVQALTQGNDEIAWVHEAQSGSWLWETPYHLGNMNGREETQEAAQRAAVKALVTRLIGMVDGLAPLTADQIAENISELECSLFSQPRGDR